ncbi:MAG: uL15 family ribosomal protein [Nanobdellota archaeon]
MTTNHRKKSSRRRGSWTSGHGEKKKRRGAGHRGGRGRAGSGKRGDAKKPSYWKKKRFFGKFGFVNPNAKHVKAVTISQLERDCSALVQKGIASKKGSTITLDLSSIGVSKLLATGTPTSSFALSVSKASPRAVSKIEKAGGSVTILAEKNDTVKKE